MRRAARYGDGWIPYFYSPKRYRDSVDKITCLGEKSSRDMSRFQWAFFPYISIYPTMEEAGEMAARTLGSQYRSGRDMGDIVRDYCVFGPVNRCVERLQQYVDAGARHIIFSLSCSREDRTRHIETISEEIIPALRERIR